MKYISVIKDTNIILSHSLLNSPDDTFMQSIDKYFLKVEDDYNTTTLFDVEPVITINTEQDKDQLITEFTFTKDYTDFNKRADINKDNLILQWCETQGKSQAECIKKNDTAYNDELDSIITSQNALKK